MASSHGHCARPPFRCGSQGTVMCVGVGSELLSVAELAILLGSLCILPS